MTEQPDWIENTPSTDQIHNDPNAGDNGFTSFFTPAKLFQIGAQLIEGLVKQVVEAIVGIFIPGGGTAVEQLAHWATSLLPAQILEPLGQLVQLLVTVLDSIPIIGPPLGDIVEDLANLFGLLKDNTGAAQGSANTANAAIAKLRAKLDAGAGGEKIIDTFDRPAASDLGANWSQTYDSGSGTLGVDGSGTAHWTPGGSTSRTCNARYLTPLNGDVQIARAIMGTAFPSANDPPLQALRLRMNTAEDAYVVGGWGLTSCEVGYVVSGTYTRLGSATTITAAAGDVWEFRAGRADGTEDYEFVLMQNDVTRCTQIDSGHASHKGPSYLYTGMIVKAGWAFSIFFGAPLQSTTPDIQVFTATDNTP